MSDVVQDLMEKITFTLKDQANEDREMTEINYPESNDRRTRVMEREDVPTAKTKAYLAKMAAVSKEQANDNRERIADLKRQLEAERRARVRAMGIETKAVRQADAAEERRRKISINRLRRAKKAESKLLDVRTKLGEVTSQLSNAEARIRSLERTVLELREALGRAREGKEAFASEWRIKAEEWEEKYKEAVETEGKKWEHAVTAWQTRYDDALKRIERLKFELAHAGGEMPEGE